MAGFNAFMNWIVPHVIPFATAVLGGALGAQVGIQWYKLRELNRAVVAIRSLAVLSYVNMHTPLWHAWCKSMGEMQIDVNTRHYHFAFDPMNPQRKTTQD